MSCSCVSKQHQDFLKNLICGYVYRFERERERERINVKGKHQSVAFQMCLDQGWTCNLNNVHLPGIEPATLWCMKRHSNQFSHLARATIESFKISFEHLTCSWHSANLHGRYQTWFPFIRFLHSYDPETHTRNCRVFSFTLITLCLASAWCRADSQWLSWMNEQY